MPRHSEFVGPEDDYVTLKEAAIMLRPVFIQLGVKLGGMWLFRYAIRQSLKNQGAR